MLRRLGMVIFQPLVILVHKLVNRETIVAVGCRSQMNINLERAKAPFDIITRYSIIESGSLTQNCTFNFDCVFSFDTLIEFSILDFEEYKVHPPRFQQIHLTPTPFPPIFELCSPRRQAAA